MISNFNLATSDNACLDPKELMHLGLNQFGGLAMGLLSFFGTYPDIKDNQQTSLNITNAAT